MHCIDPGGESELERQLPLPRALTLKVGCVIDYSRKLQTLVGSTIVETNGRQQRLDFDLAAKIRLGALETYLVELQQSPTVQQCSCELSLDAFAKGSLEIPVTRIWKQATDPCCGPFTIFCVAHVRLWPPLPRIMSRISASQPSHVLTQPPASP